jgi:hypothetical protein
LIPHRNGKHVRRAEAHKMLLHSGVQLGGMFICHPVPRAKNDFLRFDAATAGDFCDSSSRAIFIAPQTSLLRPFLPHE